VANVLRTPNKLISGVPDFPFKPRYREYAGQRLAHVDEGKGPPVVFIHGEADPILPLDVGWRFARAIGAPIDHAIAGAGHFVQEDAGPQVGRLIATWLKAQSPRKR
jgi:pimeloyl-ACP methyl ester carboxylesterase